MKKNIIFCIVFVIAVSGFALEVESRQPQFGTTQPGFDDAMATAFQSLEDGINDAVSEFKIEMPKDFLRAMGNSAVYASHGATNRGYAGYKFLSITIGPMIGLHLPAGIKETIDYLNDMENLFKDKGDINLGISPKLLNAHVGLHPGFLPFVPDNLYVGLRIGYFGLPNLFDNFSFSTFTIGPTVNFQIIPKLSLAKVIEWRGLSLGSGILINTSKLEFTFPLGEQEQDLGGTFANTVLKVDPKLKLNLDVNTVTIPLEAMTSIKLVFINIPFGIGADVALGRSKMRIGLDSDINVDGLPNGVVQTESGYFSVNEKGETPPSFFNFKIMTGLGFAFGPAILEIPLTYYPKGEGKGLNVGVTVGAAF